MKLQVIASAQEQTQDASSSLGTVLVPPTHQQRLDELQVCSSLALRALRVLEIVTLKHCVVKKGYMKAFL